MKLKTRSILIWTAILIFPISIRPITDPDFGWHFRTGQYILSHHQIPQTDLLSYTLPDYSVIYHSYLSSTLIALIYNNFGLIGLSTFYASLLTLTLTFLIRTSRPTFMSSLIIISLTPILITTIGFRTQMFSFAGLVITLIITQKIQQQGLTKNLAIGTILLFLIWTQLHPGFVLGLALLLLTSLLLHSPKTLLLALTASSLTTINPYGLKLHQLILSMSQNTVAHTYNSDWIPYFTNQLFEPLHKIVFILSIVTLILVSNKTLWIKLLTLTSLLAASFISSRYLLFTTVLTFYLASSIKPFFQNWQNIKLHSSTKIITFTMILLALGSLITQNLIALTLSPTTYHKGLHYPLQAVNIIQNLPLSNPHILNNYNWGGYLSWQLPQAKVFIDGRMDNFYVNDQSFFSTYNTLMQTNPGWENILTQYPSDVALLTPQTPLAQKLINQNWPVLYQDQHTLLLSNPHSSYLH